MSPLYVSLVCLPCIQLTDLYLLAMSEAQVRKELAEEEGQRLQNGGISLNETTPAAFLVSGLELEDMQ